MPFTIQRRDVANKPVYITLQTTRAPLNREEKRIKPYNVSSHSYGVTISSDSTQTKRAMKALKIGGR
jgi:hypothetical protein